MLQHGSPVVLTPNANEMRRLSAAAASRSGHPAPAPPGGSDAGVDAFALCEALGGDTVVLGKGKEDTVCSRRLGEGGTLE